MGNRVRRPENDDRSTRSSYSPLPHSRNRKRQLPLQEQLSESRQTHQGEIAELDQPLTQKPSSSRVSSQWKSWVSSRRKSTPQRCQRTPISNLSVGPLTHNRNAMPAAAPTKAGGILLYPVRH